MAIQCQPQRTVKFYGPLAKFLGRRSFSAIGLNSASEVMRCLLSNFPQLGSHMRGRHYRVVMNGRAVSSDELNDPVGDNHEIHIIPAICGAGGGGPLTTILTGVALIGAGLLFPFASSFLTPLGIGLVLQGVAELISPTPNVEPESTDPSNRSYNFSNIQQTSREGVPVPLVYGDIVTGSVVLSVNIERDDEKLEQVFEEGPGDPNPNQNPVPDLPSDEQTFEERMLDDMQDQYPGICFTFYAEVFEAQNPKCGPGYTGTYDNVSVYERNSPYGRTLTALSVGTFYGASCNDRRIGIQVNFTVGYDCNGNLSNGSSGWPAYSEYYFPGGVVSTKPRSWSTYAYRIWKIPSAYWRSVYPNAPAQLIAEGIGQEFAGVSGVSIPPTTTNYPTT